ncbi:MAG: PIG-L deacetylase family protein [Solirubrobacteraceae bacterium]
MLGLDLPGHRDEPLRVLALGCHSDDIEIGAGGLLLRLQEVRPQLEVHWVVFSAHGARREEARSSAGDLLDRVAGLQVDLHSFRDGYFPYEGADVKNVFEALKDSDAPDLILTHHRQDLHQDHRLVCELTWNTFRDHLVLEYEIPKYDGDLGRPNVFVPVSEEHCRRKVSVLMQHFGTQRDKHWFSEDLFLSLMRVRGMESRSATGYAEAFHGRKLVL